MPRNREQRQAPRGGAGKTARHSATLQASNTAGPEIPKPAAFGRHDWPAAKLSFCPTTTLLVEIQAVELGFGSNHQCAWPGLCRQMRA